MITLRDVHVRHGATTLVDVERLELRRGEALTIVGESGSGKSLLAQALVGILPGGLACSGTIESAEGAADLAGDRRHLWGRTVVDLPQEPAVALDPTMRVLGQVADGHPSWRTDRSHAHAEATALLTDLGLPTGVAGAWPHTLSGGMAQRVAFAAARITGAPLLVADEPSKGLDPVAVDRLATLLEQHLLSGGALLTITHDLDLARRLGGHVMVMRDAVVVEQGPADVVLDDPRHAYTRRLVAAQPHHWTHQWPAPVSGEPLLTGTGLTKAYAGRTLFADLDIDLRAGDRVSLSGPSGSGKTTLGNMLLGLVRADRGTIVRAPAVRRTGLQKLYQDPVLSFPARRPLDVTFRAVLRRHGGDRSGLEELVGRLGVDPSLLARLPGQVSGGELQRLAIARAVLARPQVLLADEPTSRLDPVTQEGTVRALVDALGAEGTALVLVTHDAALAGAVCQRSITLGGTPSSVGMGQLAVSRGG